MHIELLENSRVQKYIRINNFRELITESKDLRRKNLPHPNFLSQNLKTCHLEAGVHLNKFFFENANIGAAKAPTQGFK